jgi:hypothetical protein
MANGFLDKNPDAPDGDRGQMKNITFHLSERTEGFIAQLCDHTGYNKSRMIDRLIIAAHKELEGTKNA